MSFVTTHPEALAFAAGQLQALGYSLTSESEAVATPTAGVVPAAADQVSALQAVIFGAYGSLYQSVYAQAQAIHELFVNTLTASSGSYAAAETTNQAAASTGAVSGIGSDLAAWLGQTEFFAPSAATTLLTMNQMGNWASAYSNCIAMAGGGLFTALPVTPGDVVLGAGGLAAGVDSTVLTGAVGPAGPAGIGGAPMLAAMGRAASVGGLSVPPAWAAGAAVPESAAATLTAAGWTVAAPQPASVATIPAGMPAVAVAGKAGGLGGPRYGVKPNVMGRPALV